MYNSKNPFETAILRMAIEDFLKRDYMFDIATNSIMNIANKCKNYGPKNIFLLSRTVNNRLDSDFISSVNNALKLGCVKFRHDFLENRNILRDVAQGIAGTATTVTEFLRILSFLINSQTIIWCISIYFTFMLESQPFFALDKIKLRAFEEHEKYEIISFYQN